MAWTKPKYSRTQVNKAGQLLAADADKSGMADPDEWNQALAIINNWRSSHGYPLYVMTKTLQNRARQIDENALVAQRLKRLDSIALKLRRFDRMQLARMQDIGGCRAILSNVDQVAQLAKVYVGGIKKNPRSRIELVGYHDYINEPKSDGYRSYHLIFKYRSDSKQSQKYNGLRIEIQLRSQLQHAWATAVETVSTFTGQALKANVGRESWKRFFVLMGMAIERQERPSLINDTQLAGAELKEELLALCESLQVRNMLMGYRVALQITRIDEFEEPFQKGQSLLILDTDKKHVEVRTFARKMIARHQRRTYISKRKHDITHPCRSCSYQSIRFPRLRLPIPTTTWTDCILTSSQKGYAVKSIALRRKRVRMWFFLCPAETLLVRPDLINSSNCRVTSRSCSAAFEVFCLFMMIPLGS